jgi:hypothetical protein
MDGWMDGVRDQHFLVYTLWKHPTLLPVLSTTANVIPVLVGGADLMVPGGAPLRIKSAPKKLPPQQS